MKSLSPLILFWLLAASPVAMARHRSSGEPLSPVANRSVDSPVRKEAKSHLDINSQLDELLASPAIRLKAQPSAEPISGGDAGCGDARCGDRHSSQPALGLKLLEKASPTPTTLLKGRARLDGLKSDAVIEDPDRDDRELLIEWDRWRNKFLRAIQLQVQASLNNPENNSDPDERAWMRRDVTAGYAMPRFPRGTAAWFYVEVTNDGRVKKVTITQSSGYRDYDRAVIEGVRALEGTSLLKFPQGSHRASVTQEASIRTAASADYHYHRFGDVERLRAP